MNDISLKNLPFSPNFWSYYIKASNIYTLFIFAIITNFTLFAQHEIVKINTSNSVPLDSFIYFINTEKNIMYVDEILSNNFSETKNRHHFLFSLIKYPNSWMRFSIENPDSFLSNQILEISTPIDSVVIYEVKDKHIVRTMINSENLPFSQREIIHRKSLFRVDFKPCERKDFLIQILMQGSSFRAPIRISPIDRFIEEDDKETTLFSIYIGFMALIVLFTLLLRLVFSKNSIYLFYGCYVLFGLMYMLDGTGFAFQYIFPNLPQIEKHFTYILIQGLYLFLVLFTDKFFQNSKVKIWINLFTTLSLTSILTIILNLIKFPIFYTFQWKFTLFILAFACTLTFLITMLNFNKNKVKSILFLSGNLLVIGLSFLVSLSYFINVNLNYYFYYLPALAHAIESILILIIIVHELFSNEKLKNYLNIQFIKEQNKNLELINLNNQAELERQKAVNDYQDMIIKNQSQINLERSRIASEMHDDLGSGLTTIRYLSDRALQLAKNETDQKQIQKIADQSNELVSNMSEIIWAMNSRFDTLEILCSHIRRHASEYLEQHQIELNWSQEIQELHQPISGERRRAVFLLVKEALHNIVKHSGASMVHLEFIEQNSMLQLKIVDYGKGFEIENAYNTGNGLFNMQQRIQNIQGKSTIQSNARGTCLEFFIPISTS